MGIDPTTPEMTLLLVMLHTGTMFAVIVYFWNSWRARYFSSLPNFIEICKNVFMATAVTGALGLALMFGIEGFLVRNTQYTEIEHLFGNLYVISTGLAAVGIMIIYAGSIKLRTNPLGTREAFWVGLIQGLCLPIRGFSRSGATISTGLILGVEKERIEEFSFALAVVLTPVVILKEARRLFKAYPEVLSSSGQFHEFLWPNLIGMAAAFIAGLLALKWLSSWLKEGYWKYFGFYCLFASAVAFLLAMNG
jgi:undecaprenyl-diphosphatase